MWRNSDTDINPNLRGGGGGVVLLPPVGFLLITLNNSKTVQAVTLKFYSLK